MEILCRGLEQLPNLTAVSIVHDFEGHTDFIDLHGPLPPWYGQWSATLLGNTMPPTSWNLCDEMAKEAEEGEDENESSMDVLTDYPWDWRGVVNLTKAISSYSPKIIRLHYGSQLSRIPLYTLNDASIATSLKHIAGNLRCFKFDASTAVDGAHQKSLTSDSQAFGVLREVLEHAQHLTTLSTSTHTWLPAWQRTSEKLSGQSFQYYSLVIDPWIRTRSKAFASAIRTRWSILGFGTSILTLKTELTLGKTLGQNWEAF